MDKGQGHGDHIGAIIDTDVFVQNHLQSIIENSKLLQQAQTIVNTDSINNVETTVYALKYGDGAINWLALLAENKKKKTAEFVSVFPVLEPTGRTKATITAVEEWDNCIEATITCTIDDTTNLSFFALDYAYNKSRYVVGNTLYIDLAALAYNAEEADRGFKFEGQEAIDFLAKIGQEPTYDASGNVEPVNFSTEDLVAFLQINDDYLEDHEFQSPVSNIKSCETFGVTMISCQMLFKHDPDRNMALYLKSDKIPSLEDNMPVRGVLWVQGKISESQEADGDFLENTCVNPIELGKKGNEYVDFFQNLQEKVSLGPEKLNPLFKTLDKIHIDDGYVLDFYEMGDEMGARCEMYVHKKGSLLMYKPDKSKRTERQKRLFMSQEDKKKLPPFEDNIAPYNDNMCIVEMIDWKEAKQVPEIWGYLTVPFTKMGIWQAYLLTKAYSLLPKKWHGFYNDLFFVFEREDIEILMENRGNVLKQKDYSFLDQCLDTDELFPRVEINGDTAVVTYTSWSNWGGLRKISVPVDKNGKTVSFGEESHKTLIAYDCGIRF